MTSPCSVPEWLRFLIPLETPAQQAVCRWHDGQYDLGGSHEERLRVDLEFCRRLLEAQMAAPDAERYFWGVRQYGGGHWRGADIAGAEPLHDPNPGPQA